MFDRFVSGAASPGERVRAYARVENAACAARLSAMADLLEQTYAASGSAEREQWRCDNWAAVCAQIGAAQTLTSGMVNALLTNAVVLRERLPKVAAIFAEGLITYLLVRTICQRTALVQDPAALRAIDAELAEQLRNWGAKSLSQTDADIDTLVLRHDPYAVRRAENAARTTGVTVHTDGATGVAHVDATVNATDGAALDRRADLLARTVCDHDPRTLDQRRAAALGAMGFGWDRLPCMCEEPDCDAAARPPVGGVVIHVIGREDALGDAGNGATAEPAADPDPEVGPPPDPEPETPTPPEAKTPAPRTGDLTAQRRALAGARSPLLSKPLREYTLAQLIAELNADPGEFSPASPGNRRRRSGSACGGRRSARDARHDQEADPSGPGPTGTALPTLANAGRLRARSRLVLPSPWLHPAHRRSRSHHPPSLGTDVRVELGRILPSAPPAENLLAGLVERAISRRDDRVHRP